MIPTRTRYLVLGLLCLLSGILYLDRICIASAIESIQRDLQLTNTQGSYVLMAFTLAYGLFEVPTGRWGDRIGARRVLTRISLWWSVFTALTGACTGLLPLITVRFLFGAGEAGAFPNVARVIARWFPLDERGRAQGVLLAASQAGGAVSPFVAALLIQAIGWRWTFVTFGSLGVAWAAGFWWWFRDDPTQHAGVNAAEIERIGQPVNGGPVHTAIPWPQVGRSYSVWWLSLIMVCASFNSYIYFSWFPKYLKAGRGASATEAGLMGSLVLTGAAVGTFGGGWILDYVGHRGGLRRRRLLGGACFFVAAAALACALATNHLWGAAAWTAVSCFAAQATQPLWWSCVIGISGRHVGALFGLMNSAGVFGALSSQYLVGLIADTLGNRGYIGRAQWDPIFYINLGILLMAGVLWLTVRLVAIEPTSQQPTP